MFVVDAQEPQISRLLKGGIGLSRAVERGDIGLDVAGLVPVARLELIFFGIEILLAPGNRLVLQKFEPVIDSVIAGVRRAT
jgi:hypothetical protein